MRDDVVFFVDEFGLPERVVDVALDWISFLKGFDRVFNGVGGVDAAVVVGVFVACRVQGCPVPAGCLLDAAVCKRGMCFGNGFSDSKVVGLGRRFASERGVDGFLVDAGDFIGFYSGRVGEDLTLSDVCGLFGVSETAVISCNKELVGCLTGVKGLELDSLELTAESFGFHGEGFEDLCVFVWRRVRDEELGVLSRSPCVLAASVLYVSGKVI